MSKPTSFSSRDALVRCASCGASLPRGVEICKYCGARYDHDAREFQFKKLVPAGAKRHCPRCPERLLESVDLSLDGPFHVERCMSCHGLFFDPGELQQVIEHWSKNVFVHDLARLGELGSLVKTWDAVVYLKCPVCREQMARRNFGKGSRVIIDSCHKHGIWLDGGELSTLFKWASAGGHLGECALDQERRRLRQSREARQSEGASKKESLDDLASVFKFLSGLK